MPTTAESSVSTSGLRDLLIAAGADIARRDDWWRFVCLIDNVAAIHPTPDAPTDLRWRKGFNMIVLGENGAPRYFGKCRHVTHEKHAHECDVLVTLSREPAFDGFVPPTTTAVSEVLRLQLSEYLVDDSLAESLASMTVDEWARVIDVVLERRDEMASRAAELLDWLRPSRPTVSLTEAAAAALEYIRNSLDLDPASLRAIEGALEQGGDVPSVIQHGDLWPANVLRRGSGWTIVDFEDFGLITVPLFDYLHLLRFPPGARPVRQPILLTGAEAMDPVAVIARETLARQIRRREMSPEQAVGAITYYVVEFAARMHGRPAAREANWGPFVADLHRIGAMLQRGELPAPG